MQYKNEKMIIAGPGASGKDYLAEKLMEMGLKKSVSYTTRPKRDGEVNGETYNFITREKFEEMISNDEFYEYEVFLEDWYYGSTIKDWNECNLFIKTVGGVSQVREEDRKDCFVVYLDIDEDIRYDRLLERKDVDSVNRRINADKEDFRKFENFDLRIRDENFTAAMVYDLMS
jgi:guanylate kinase